MAQRPPDRPAAEPAISLVGWPSTRVFFGIAIGIAVVAFLIRLPYLAEPFDTDEGGYAYIARALLGGQVPYRDAWDNKPPLVFFAYAGALALADRIEAIRLLAALVVTGSTLLLIGLAREAFDRRVGLLAGAAFVFATAAPRLQGTNANTEIFLLPGWIGAAWLVLIGLRTRSIWPWPAAGAAIGIALLAKPVAGWAIVAVAATLILLVSRGAVTGRVALARLGWLVVGVAAVLLPFAAYFAINGALGEAAHANVFFNRLYLARNFAFAVERYGLPATILAPNRDVILEDPAVWLFGVTGLVTVALVGRGARPVAPDAGDERIAERVAPSARTRDAAGRPISKRDRRVRPGRARAARVTDAGLVFLICWTFAGFLGAKTGWLELAHYYLQVVPALSLWLAAYLIRIVPVLSRSNPIAPWFIGAIGIAMVVWSLASWWPVWLAGSPDRFHALKFPFPDRGEWDVEAPAIAAEVRARTSLDDRIFIWGREPQIYYYAGRRAASRYIHDRPVWIEAGVVDQIGADLAASRPALVLDTLDPIFFPEATQPIDAVLPPGYRLAGRLGFADVYERSEGP